MPSFSISYWDLIKLPYFENTIERRGRGETRGDGVKERMTLQTSLLNSYLYLYIYIERESRIVILIKKCSLWRGLKFGISCAQMWRKKASSQWDYWNWWLELFQMLCLFAFMICYNMSKNTLKFFLLFSLSLQAQYH